MRLEIYLLIAVIVLILGMAVLIGIKKYKSFLRKKNIIALFEQACKEKNVTEYQLFAVKTPMYDFYFESSTSIYYVKVILNVGNKELCVNNAVKWQLRERGFNETMHFIDGVENLMKMSFRHHSEKKEHKLFIIYPGARALLKVINECEMVFIYPETDVYGAQVINYLTLVENPSILEV